MLLRHEYEREAYARMYKRLQSLEPGEQTVLEALRDTKRGRVRKPLPIPARDTPEWEHCDRLRYSQLIVVREWRMSLSPLCQYHLDTHGERFPWETPDC